MINHIVFLSKCFKRMTCIALSIILTLAIILIGFSDCGVQAVGATGQGLANWAMRAYNERWSYVWGGARPGAVDCSGLIYSYVGYGPRTTEQMLASARRKGSISTLPDVVGTILYQYGHVGVYVGNGMAVDARDSSSGVCYSPVSSHGWTMWLQHPNISYSGSGGGYYPKPKSKAKVHTTSTIQNNILRVGSSGKKVTRLQKRLHRLRYYDNTISGYFGTQTKRAVKKFQKKSGIAVTGNVDTNTKSILYSSSAIKFTPNAFKIGMKYREIKTYKKRLVDLEYMPKGSASTYFDKATRNAVINFQDTSKLVKTGTLNQRTIARLTSKNAVLNPKSILLQQGSMDAEAVKEVQTQLSELRYVQAYNTGVYDDSTVAGIKQFQNTNGLDVTGKLSREDKATLFSKGAKWSAESDNLQLGFKGKDVKQLQQNLADLHYDCKINSYFDKATENAVKQFQNDSGMTPNGIATLSVRIALKGKLSAMNYSKTTNTGYRVTNLTDNSLAPTNYNFIIAVTISSILGALILGLLSLLYLKKRKHNK